MKKVRGRMLMVILLGLCCWPSASLAQAADGTGSQMDVMQAQQLAAERNTLLEMLNDPNTPAEKKAVIQSLLAWNTRGVTIAEVKKMQAQPPVVASTTPPPPPNNLAEAEAAPLPANVNVGSGAMLQNFSKGRDAEASSRASSSLGLVKAQQEMDSATRESEAKIRDAQNIRNQAGASALAQRQQDAASAASQQAAGSIGNMLGDSLVQSVQQGAQAAGQAIGGGAVGRMSGAIGQTGSGGGAVAGVGGGGGLGEMAGGAAAAGASAAAGQIFGGGAPASSGGGVTAEQVSGGGQPAASSASGGGVAVEAATKRIAMDRRVAQPQSGRGMVTCYRCKNQFRCNICANPDPNVMAKHAHVCPNCERQGNAPVALFDALCPKHGKYGGEIGKVKGCPKCEAEKRQMWDAFCKVHGKYGGQGPVTGCPKCAEEVQHWMPKNGLR